MKYYVTIYIDPLVECFLDFKNQCYWQREDFTHAFLGLTKGKSPDELDKADETLRQEYLKNKEWDKIDQKWYEAKEPNEFNDGFWGSTRQMETYKPKIYIIPQITFEDILRSPKTKQYYLYNQDYQDYQKFTPYGLDFKLYSKDFITKLDFKDKAYNVLYNTGV
ncbi:hypothetical protein [Campylobacter jejuni]|uniref:hypothetical protein n=1 Tax=Campylobacter jejuni TaxID=197 RepID=UPI000A604B78|nr:hypothetical protein [Campylobacter jejuni]HBD2710066.1 hypothetical protein [Campylobacter jejuni]HBK6297242.1 hypothetical protein [Campylobacter jejuni]HEF2528157.1 hypothetical protein [Campylobacter jejuni]HEF7932345.1 hypothetical protein [Campylobacter jejuni]HEG2430836.1 hypothetical protein [Campylobacter jejuni]